MQKNDDDARSGLFIQTAVDIDKHADESTLCLRSTEGHTQKSTNTDPLDYSIQAAYNATSIPSTSLDSGSSTEAGESVVYRTILPTTKLLTDLIHYLKWNKIILIYEDATCK